MLGATLFERTKRSVMLTSLGQGMVVMANDVVVKLDNLSEMANSAGAPLTGRLRMGVIPTIGPFLLPRVLPGLRDKYPELQLYLREEPTHSLLRKLADGQLELVLLALPYKTERVEIFEFAIDPFLAIFPRGHRMGTFETLTPARFDKAALLALEGENCLTDQILDVARAGEKILQDHFQASSLHTLVQMVDNGLGVTIVPKMAIDGGILRGLRLEMRPFSSPNAHRRIALVWRRSSVRGNEYRLLGEILRDELGTPMREAFLRDS